MSNPPSGNPFAAPPPPAGSGSSLQQAQPSENGGSGSNSQPPASQPSFAQPSNDTKVTGTIETFPVTGYPVQYSGGAFSSSYFGGASSCPPPYPPPPSYPPPTADPGQQPLYATFEQSAPYQEQPMTPLACGIGVQWVIFCIGWLLWPLWYVGVILRWVGKFDPRERAGWIANAVMSLIFTIIWVAIVSEKAYNQNHSNDDVICTIDGCLR